MATPRDGHRKRMEILKMLAEYGLDDPEIAQTLGVSLATVEADRHVLKIDKKAPYHHPKAHFAHLVSAYAELAADKHAQRPELKRGLEIALRIPEILAALKGAQAAVSAPITRNPRVECYRKVLVAIFGTHANQWTAQDPKEFFEEYLSKLYFGELPLPDSFETLRDCVLAAYLAEEMIWTKPGWRGETADLIIQIVDEMIATLTQREQDILKLRFCLEDAEAKPETFSQLGRRFNIATERARQIQLIAIRKLSRLGIFSLQPLLESATQLLEGSLRQRAQARREQESRKLIEQEKEQQKQIMEHGLTLIDHTDAQQWQGLGRAIDELGLSVRAHNGLKNANIKTVWELVQKNERDLLKTRWLGRKSLKEVKEILAGMGLRLGMRFNKATQRAHEALVRP